MRTFLAFLLCLFVSVPVMARPIFYSGEIIHYGAYVNKRWTGETDIKYSWGLRYGIEFRLYGIERKIHGKTRCTVKGTSHSVESEQEFETWKTYFVRLSAQKRPEPYSIVVEIIVDGAVMVSKTFTILPEKGSPV